MGFGYLRQNLVIFYAMKVRISNNVSDLIKL